MAKRGFTAVEVVDAQLMVIADPFDQCAAQCWVKSMRHQSLRGSMRSSATVSMFHVKINLCRGPVHYFLSVQLHIERVHMRPLDPAHGFPRLGHGIGRRLGKALLGSSDHFDHL